MGAGDANDIRLLALEKGLERNTAALDKISEAINRFSLLEERHLETRGALERAFQAIEKQEKWQDETDKRLTAIEIAMPQLKETRKWVVMGILAGVSMIGAGLFKLLMSTPIGK